MKERGEVEWSGRRRRFSSIYFLSCRVLARHDAHARTVHTGEAM